MTDVDIMIKALRLAWIPRLLNPDSLNWKSIPDYFFKKLGGLNFLHRCNYDTKYLDHKLPAFYTDILSYFSELKVAISSKFFISISDSISHLMSVCERKFDLDKMQSFLEVLKAFKFAAILVHHSHQSSLLFE